MPRFPTTPATIVLDQASVSWIGHTYTHDPRAESFGREAAEALGYDPARVFKTLVIEVDGQLAVAILPVNRNLNLKLAAAALDGKTAALAAPRIVTNATGYVLGGVSPLGMKRTLPTVLDSSAAVWETILVSGGRRGFDVELAASDLRALTRATMAEVTR